MVHALKREKTQILYYLIKDFVRFDHLIFFYFPRPAISFVQVHMYMTKKHKMLLQSYLKQRLTSMA